MIARRTKKSKDVVTVVETIDNIVVEATAPTKSVTVKPSKKQKKPINIVAVVTPNGIEGSFMLEQRRPLIAHLPISADPADTG